LKLVVMYASIVSRRALGISGITAAKGNVSGARVLNPFTVAMMMDKVFFRLSLGFLSFFSTRFSLPFAD
jgi:hypothetical protein